MHSWRVIHNNVQLRQPTSSRIVPHICQPCPNCAWRIANFALDNMLKCCSRNRSGRGFYSTQVCLKIESAVTNRFSTYWSWDRQGARHIQINSHCANLSAENLTHFVIVSCQSLFTKLKRTIIRSPLACSHPRIRLKSQPAPPPSVPTLCKVPHYYHEVRSDELKQSWRTQKRKQKRIHLRSSTIAPIAALPLRIEFGTSAPPSTLPKFQNPMLKPYQKALALKLHRPTSTRLSGQLCDFELLPNGNKTTVSLTKILLENTKSCEIHSVEGTLNQNL